MPRTVRWGARIVELIVVLGAGRVRQRCLAWLLCCTLGHVLLRKTSENETEGIAAWEAPDLLPNL